MTIEKQGDYEVKVQDANGNELEPLLLKDVSVIPNSPFNLLSVALLCEQGSAFHFEKNNSWFTYKGHRFPLEERGGLYLIHLDQILKATDLSEIQSAHAKRGYGTEEFKCGETQFGCAATLDMWHQRLGHASKGRIKFLYQSGAAEGLQIANGKDTHDVKCRCPTCSAIHNEKLHIGDVRTFDDDVSQVGTVVTDVCDPFPASIEGIEGYCWVISFTDVYSRFSACYFLRNKSDAESALESLIQYFRREGHVVKKIISDAGGEYGGGLDRIDFEHDAAAANDLGFVFSRVCKEHKIQHLVTPPNRPELHGLSERWNKSVMKMANSLLYSSRLSHVLWPCAVAHANCVRNRLPVRSLGKHTPYELFFHKRPRLSDFKVWGCDAYVLLPPGQLPGQHNRKRLIFVGFTPDKMGYKCFDPITFKFSTHFELLFDEESSKKRINSLREYDIRRELARRGKLEQYPLEANDFDPNDSEHLAAQDSERRLFTFPQPLPAKVRKRGGISGKSSTEAQSSEHEAVEPSGLKGLPRADGKTATQHARDDLTSPVALWVTSLNETGVDRLGRPTLAAA